MECGAERDGHGEGEQHLAEVERAHEDGGERGVEDLAQVTLLSDGASVFGAIEQEVVAC